MRKKLIISGCSFTNLNYRSLHHPDLDCSWPKWPEILADKLDMDLICKAMSGAGSEYIYSTITDELLSHNKSNIGLAIVAWSSSERFDYMKKGTWANLVESPYGEYEYFINKSLRYYYAFQLFCEYHSIPYKHVQMIPISRKWMDDYNIDTEKNTIIASPHFHELSSDNFIGYPIIPAFGGYSIQYKLTNDWKETNNFAISDEDAHPSENGHKMIADFIYENL